MCGDGVLALAPSYLELEAKLAEAEARAERLAVAATEFASQYGSDALACCYDNGCFDSGREPMCVPCAFRAALLPPPEPAAGEVGRGR